MLRLLRSLLLTLLALCVWTAPSSAEFFSVVLVSDTQNTEPEDQGWQNQVEFITTYKDTFNIIFVAGLGDVVNFPYGFSFLGTDVDVGGEFIDTQGGYWQAGTGDVVTPTATLHGLVADTDYHLRERGSNEWSFHTSAEDAGTGDNPVALAGEGSTIIVMTSDVQDERWQNISDGYAAIEAAGINVGVIDGNHDGWNHVADVINGPDFSQFLSYWTPARQAATPNWVGTNPDIGCTLSDWPATNPGGAYLNNYWKVDSTLGYDIIFLGLTWEEEDCVYTWASGIAQANPTTPMFVFIHRFMDEESDPDPECHIDPTQQDVWDLFANLTRTVFAVVSGHHTSVNGNSQCFMVVDNDAGQATLQMVYNMQGTFEGGIMGSSWLRILTFQSDNGGELFVRTVVVGQNEPMTPTWGTDAGSGSPYYARTQQVTVPFPTNGFWRRQQSSWGH